MSNALPRRSTLLYESEHATVYHGDARRVLASLDTESVDLVIADPPYGKKYQSNIRAKSFDEIHGDGADDRQAIHDVLLRCVRLVGQNRHLYVFGPTDVLDGLKVSEPVPLVWDKGIMSAGDLNSAWGPAHEPISFAVSKHRHAGQAGKGSVAARQRKGTVLRFTRPTGRKVSRHPTEKPLGLLAELIESSSRIGELVLDPYGGSGSTAVTAVLRGRRAITMDINLDYAQAMVERVKKAEALAHQIREA